MKLTVVAVIALLLTDNVPIISASGWNYGDEADWPEKCALGKRQSPIALSQYKSIRVENHEPFEFRDYDINQVTITNNGHSVEIRPAKSLPKAELRGGGLSKVYQFDHLHFHWKSEHAMDDIRFPLEIHLVHFAKEYGSLANALKYPDGLAVLGVFCHLSIYDAQGFIQISNIVESLVMPGSTTEKLYGTTIKDFLPRDLGSYFRYNGSRTTPDCDESVIWTVFLDTIPISLDQIAVFERIRTDNKTKLLKNYRTIRPLNGRTVFLVNSPFPISPDAFQISRGNSVATSRLALIANLALVIFVASYVGFSDT